MFPHFLWIHQGLLLPSNQIRVFLMILIILLQHQFLLPNLWRHLAQLLIHKILQVLIVHMLCQHLRLRDRLIIKPILRINQLQITHSVSLIWHMVIIQLFMHWRLPLLYHLFRRHSFTLHRCLHQFSLLGLARVRFCVWREQAVSDFHRRAFLKLTRSPLH